MPSQGIIVTVEEFLSRVLIKVNELSDLLRMKLKANKTKTMIVTQGTHNASQSPALTIRGSVLKQSDDLVTIL